MAKEKRYISEPTAEDEALLDDIMEDSADEVRIRGRKFRVRWLKRGTLRKISHIMAAEAVGEGNGDDKVSCKAAAAVTLNGYWKIKLWWWARWRWFYYVRQYGDGELLDLMAVAKKKVPQQAYLTVSILLTALRDTAMTMTMKEASLILHGQDTGKAGNSAASTNG